MMVNVLLNWSIREDHKGRYVLDGTIYHDAKGRFLDGTDIRTSPLRLINFSAGYADTKNTRYYLGRRDSDG